MKTTDATKIQTSETRLPLTGSIRAMERKWISNAPQTIFRGRSFLIDDAMKGCFLVHDIRVGRNSQLAAQGAVPLEVFAGKDAQTTFDTCQVAMVFEMLVENVSGRDLGFGIMVVGDEPSL